MGEARTETLRRLYAAFNARDVEQVLASLHPEVDWPDMLEGKRLHGRDAVRDYWRRQFETIDSHVRPVGFEEDGDEITVRVQQRVRDAGTGAVLDEREVRHVHRFEGDLVARMDVR